MLHKGENNREHAWIKKLCVGETQDGKHMENTKKHYAETCETNMNVSRSMRATCVNKMTSRRVD